RLLDPGSGLVLVLNPVRSLSRIRLGRPASSDLKLHETACDGPFSPEESFYCCDSTEVSFCEFGSGLESFILPHGRRRGGLQHRLNKSSADKTQRALPAPGLHRHFTRETEGRSLVKSENNSPHTELGSDLQNVSARQVSNQPPLSVPQIPPDELRWSHAARLKTSCKAAVPLLPGSSFPLFVQLFSEEEEEEEEEEEQCMWLRNERNEDPSHVSCDPRGPLDWEPLGWEQPGWEQLGWEPLGLGTTGLIYQTVL
ncbi:unnamed protein product, partial [Pleuronectes platessa]